MTRRALALAALILVAITLVVLLWRHPSAGARISYGSDRLQHADLWLPRGKGPFPVALLIHGGCWRSGPHAAETMDRLASVLRDRGIAVWNIDYRGINQAGFPATFADVAAGADALRGAAARYMLDLKRVVAVGHSAGGHLALWLAARPSIPRSSPLYAAAPLAVKGVVSLGGPPDLEADRTALAGPCGADAIDTLVGTPGARRADVFADTSPARLPPPSIPITLISGGADTVVPPGLVAAYAARAGGRARHVIVPGAGHGDLIVPGTRAGQAAIMAIEARLG